MRLFLIILPIFIFTFQVKGQIVKPTEPEDVGFEIAKIKNLEFNRGKKYLSENEIAGSPYLNKNFIPASIVKTNGTEIKDMSLRYNIYSNTMEFKKEGKALSIAFPSEIFKIRLGGKVFVYSPYMTEKNVSSGYFQMLYEGRYHLLKKYEVVLKMPSETRTQSDDSARFVSTPPHYFLRYGDGMAHLIDSRKKLIKFLQPIPQGLINYIETNKIKMKDEKQLMELMELLEEL